MSAKQEPKTSPFLEEGHDHGRCIRDALAEAGAVCMDRGVRLTALRRRVLEIIWQSHRPLGAYSILDWLRQDGRSAAPPTVYRALEFLLQQGLIHRIASLNAFVGCVHPGHVSGGQFLLCRACGTSAELHDGELTKMIIHSAAALGFRTECQTIELAGLCPRCQPSPAATDRSKARPRQLP